MSALALAAGVWALLWLTLRLPRRPAVSDSTAVCADADSPIARVLPPHDSDGLSGVQTLADPRIAFAVRVWLARRAVGSLDLQYYIWRNDVSGRMLLDEVRAAADRGVRVRLLLDDNGTSGLDRELLALSAHPDIAVRLFNPFRLRWPRWINYLVDFPRLNRRMHNKCFVADGRAAVVGGRNVGDEYFGASETALFADLDVLAVGAIVPAVAADFDRFWNSAAAWPVAAVVGRQPRPQPRPADHRDLARSYQSAVDAAVGAGLALGSGDFEWTRVTMVSDDPAKVTGRLRRGQLLAERLVEALGRPRRSLGLVTPYFVPGRIGARFLSSLARSGVTVSVLTNALRATDVALVHTGYARRRRTLLRAGVALWELKGDGIARARLSLRSSGGRRRGTLRSRGSALHAKTFAIDGERLFIGSFNFDPRSVHLNTELGFVIDSPTLAGQLGEVFASGIYDRAYRVTLDGRRLVWTEAGPDGPRRFDREPGTRWYQRLVLRAAGLLPIEWLL